MTELIVQKSQNKFEIFFNNFENNSLEISELVVNKTEQRHTCCLCYKIIKDEYF